MVMEGVDLQSIEVGGVVGHIVEVGVENNIEASIDDIVEKIEGIWDFYHKDLTTLVTKMSFEIDVANFSM